MMAKIKAVLAKRPARKPHKASAASPAGDVAVASNEAPAGRLLKAGTTIFLPGLLMPFTLTTDARINFEGSDRSWAGTLASDRKNFHLNIVEVEGVWNPITGQKEE